MDVDYVQEMPGTSEDPLVWRCMSCKWRVQDLEAHQRVIHGGGRIHSFATAGAYVTEMQKRAGELARGEWRK